MAPVIHSLRLAGDAEPAGGARVSRRLRASSGVVAIMIPTVCCDRSVGDAGFSSSPSPPRRPLRRLTSDEDEEMVAYRNVDFGVGDASNTSSSSSASGLRTACSTSVPPTGGSSRSSARASAAPPTAKPVRGRNAVQLGPMDRIREWKEYRKQGWGGGATR